MIGEHAIDEHLSKPPSYTRLYLIPPLFLDFSARPYDPDPNDPDPNDPDPNDPDPTSGWDTPTLLAASHPHHLIPAHAMYRNLRVSFPYI